MKKILLVTLTIALALTFAACEDGKDNPMPNEGTITAFGKTVNVTGDTSIPYDDFIAAKAKLEDAIMIIDGISEAQVKYEFIVMFYIIPNFAMIIEEGNAPPDANANKSMTVGVDYLLDNDVTTETILVAIFAKINSGVFILPEVTSGDYAYMGNTTLLITKYTGPGGDLIIPSTINGGTVAAIAQGTVNPTVGQYGRWEGVFYNKNLTSVTIPDSVIYIGGFAFNDNQLTSVDIPNSVPEIGFYAFTYNQLENVTIPYGVITIGSEAFSNNKLTNITISDSVTTIGHRAFYQNQLMSVDIPNSVTTIEGAAFQSNELTNVTISNSVTSIEDATFEGNQLTSVTIPNGVTSIGDRAFRRNQLTSITIGADVTIGIDAFDDNNSISSGFETAYNDGGKLAGTYTRADTSIKVWTKL